MKRRALEGTILVLAKAPIPGVAKTRLHPPCTLLEAARIAEAALADTLRTVSAVPVRRRVLALDGPIGPWLRAGITVASQRGDGLGERLASAFEAIEGPALLIGMDTPQVSPDLLGGAIERLTRDGCDAVLGPAVDGGWWAIGLRRPDPRVFDGVPMSVPHTGAAQIRRLRQLGHRWTALPTLRDVDRFDDALAVAEAIPRSAFAEAVAVVAARIGRSAEAHQAAPVALVARSG